MMKLLPILCLSLALVGPQAIAQESDTQKIPAAEMFPIKQSYAAAAGESTNTKKRRAYKKVVRNSKALLKQYPDSNDRYQLLDLIFKCQQELLLINNTEETREDVFETAKEIVKAPMEFSTIRLQPDILLLRSKLANADLPIETRLASIKEMAELYFETDAEATCLMYLTMIAKDLEDAELFKELKLNLSTRFAQDAEASAFLRERFGVSKRDLRFSGEFRSLKGQTISFPVDLIGHNYLVCFWSTKTPELQKRFSLVKEYQEKTDGNFKVFSFNTDELDDAGQSILEENSLDWTPMHLPDGINSKAFLGFAHAKSSYTLLPSNAMGYSLGKSSNRATMHDSDVDMYAILNKKDYLSLMQTLSSGHFLISESESEFKSNTIQADKLNALKDLFVPFQIRYRLSDLEVVENYQSAVTLCDEIIKTNPTAAELWQVRNSKIIALLGLWKIQLSSLHLEAAVAEANIALATKDIPAAAKVIPEFCLATSALRGNNADAVTVINNFIAACGGADANAEAHAAAVILAIDGGQSTRDLYLDHRYIILDKFLATQSILPVTSYLLKELYAKYLFQADEKTYYFGQTSIYGSQHPDEDRDRIIRQTIHAEFTTVQGEKLSLPDEDKFSYHLCTFLDLPEDAAAEVDQIKLINGLLKTAATCRRNDMKLVLFFLSQDTTAIKAYLEKYQLKCAAVSLPGGLGNPILTKLGIYSPENFANTALIGPNGDLVINYSKMHHRGVYIHKGDEDLNPWFNSMSPGHLSKDLRGVTSRYDTEIGNQAYANKNWSVAARHLSLTFSDQEKALRPNINKLKDALAKANNPRAVLEFLNHSIATHKKPQYGIYRFPWQLHLDRSKVYDQLGEKAKAEADRKYSAELKIKDDAAVANLNKGKQSAAEKQKKKEAEELKATQERIKKLKEAEAEKN